LARAHAASVAGDALFAIGLAGSVFFSLDFTSARWRVALYLLLTIAPFAIAAPLIGPAIDRIKGGRRWIIVGSMVARAILAFFVVRHMDTLLFYPEAFGMLVMQKIYSISKSAVVPSTVHSDEELVRANSQLTTLSSIAVVVAAVPGGILYAIGGGEATVALGAIVFAIGVVLSLQLPPTRVAMQPADELERRELRSAGILHASNAMGLLRGVVGFLAFMLAFDLKQAGSPLWELGFVAATAQFGFFVGSLLVPRLRRFTTEERIVLGSLLVTTVGGLLTAAIGGLAGMALLSMLVGMTSCSAKQSFDAIVQRDAPDANRGRSFARFETRFQLLWVIGALLPVIVPIPAPTGFALIAVATAVAAVVYLLGMRNLRAGRLPTPRRGVLRRRVVVDERHPSAREDTTVVQGFAPPFVPVGGDDPTMNDTSRPDPARRWMRAPVDGDATTSFGAPPSSPSPSPSPSPRPPRVSGERPPSRRTRGGRLFDDEAWDDPPDDGIRPPF
jgi:MFS family permease